MMKIGPWLLLAVSKLAKKSHCPLYSFLGLETTLEYIIINHQFVVLMLLDKYALQICFGKLV